jgi:hypothetical protein
MLEWSHGRPYRTKCNGATRNALHIYVPSNKTAQKNEQAAWSTAVCCICTGIDAGFKDRQALRRVCPTHALQRWRRVAPLSTFVFTRPGVPTGVPMSIPMSIPTMSIP